MAGGTIAKARDDILARLRTADRKDVIYLLAVAVGVLLLMVLLHLPHGPEHWSADLRTALLSPRQATQHKRIAIVYVTEQTLAGYPYLSPTERQLLADTIKAVDAASPAAIGFDFIIDRPTEPAKDNALIAALRDAKAPVVLGVVDDGGQFQTDYIDKTKRSVGHIYFERPHKSLVINDRVIRLMAKPSYSRVHKETFAEQLTQKVGSYPKPKSEYISWLLQPKDGTETFLTLSAEQVLGRDSPTLPIKEMLKDKIVLIGGNFPDRDQHLIPLSVRDEKPYPGLFIHAQILAQILDQRSLSTLGWPLQTLVFILAGLAGFWIGRRHLAMHLVLELVSVVVLIGIGIVAFTYGGLIFPYTGVLLMWLVGAGTGYYSRREAHGGE